MILHYLKMACRHLCSVKWQALISVLGLAAGLTLFTVCNSFLRSELAANKQFATYDRLVALTSSAKGKSTRASLFTDERLAIEVEKNLFVDNVVLKRGTDFCSVSVTNGIDVNARFCCVEGNFSKVFPMPLVEGAMEPFDADNKSVIISQEFAERLFGSSKGVIGKQITIVRVAGTDIGESLRVVAVFEDYDKCSDGILGNVDFILNAKSSSAKPLISVNRYYRIYATLHSMGDLEALNNIAIKDGWSERFDPFRARGSNATELRFCHVSELGFISVMIYSIVSIAGFTILLVSIIYALNLFVGLFMLRAKELKLRNFLGAGYVANCMLLFTELLIVATCSMFMSVVFCEILYNVIDINLYSVLSKVQMIKHIMHYALCLILLFIVVSVLLISLMNKVGNNQHRVKNVTLAVQFFITLLFLALFVIFNSMRTERINAVAPYISEAQMKRILVMRAPAPYEKFTMCKSSIETLPQLSVAWRLTNYSMFENRLLSKYFVNVDYLKMLNLPGAEALNEGDGFCYITKDMESSVDENGNITIDNEVFRVTQIISGNNPSESIIYLPANEFDPSRSELFMRVNDGYSFDETYEKLVEILGKYYVVTNAMIQTLYFQTVGGNVSVFMVLALCAMIISLLITISGIVGTITLDTNRRKKEVAIRKINGAGFKQIYWLFAKLYFKIYLIVALLVTLILFYVNNLQLFGELFNVSFMEWFFVYLFAAFVIFLSICSKIYQVSRINPSDMLRAE